MELVRAHLTVFDVWIFLQATWADIGFGTWVCIYPLHSTEAASERGNMLKVLLKLACSTHVHAVLWYKRLNIL